MMPFAENFTDAEAAERLLNRACREWAEMAYYGDSDLGDGFYQMYGWLKSVSMESGEKSFQQADQPTFRAYSEEMPKRSAVRDPITGQNLGPSD